MEKLKLMIPDDLKRMISESTPENLTSICSSLLDFFLSLPEFQRVIILCFSILILFLGKIPPFLLIHDEF